MRFNLLGIIMSVTLMMMPACSPTYPKCNDDDDCKEKGEFCVNGMCQECRDTQDCPKGKTCNAGRCELTPGYCESTNDCPDRLACIKNRCTACKNNVDCGEGMRCKKGQCLRPGQCVDDEDCPMNHECQNGNCVAPPTDATGPCQPSTVYFDFNESILTSESTQKLQQATQCIKSVASRRVRVEGHCDPRGTEEYNLALGDRRAQSVRQYLTRLGINATRLRSVSKGKLEATGTDESGWALDRKASFIWE